MVTAAVLPDIRSDPGAAAAGPPVLDVVIPVHNEERDLEACVRRLHAHLGDHLPYSVRITIADNASGDATPLIAQRLARELGGVRAVRLEERGRGRALSAVWSASDATVFAYMDVDMSTDLAALLPLVAPLLSGHSDVAIGSRLASGSRVIRGSKRELISRAYNMLLHATLATGFSDAQCGFKAITAAAARRLLPLVEDTGWFFDTELLVLAERSGLRIHEVPVDWVDDPDSRVRIASTAGADLAGIARLARSLITGRLPLDEVRRELGRRPLTAPGAPAAHRLRRQLLSFALIGGVSTLAYLGLYALLRGSLDEQPANVIALLLTSVANTAANRRLTFGMRGRAGAGRHQLEGLGVFALGLLVTGLALHGLEQADPDAGRLAELAALVAANLAGTVLRFALFRAWVFRPRRHAAPADRRSWVS